MAIPDQINESLRVVIIAKSSRERLNLKSILETNDLRVVPDSVFIKSLSEPSEKKIADVLLVDLDESDEHCVDVLDQIMEKTDMPVLFNDSAGTKNQHATGGLAWGRRLAKKLEEIVGADSKGRVVEQISQKDNSNMDADVESSVEVSKQEKELAESNKPIAAIVQSLNGKQKEQGVDYNIQYRPSYDLDEQTVVIDDEIDISKYERKIAENRQKMNEADSIVVVPQPESHPVPTVNADKSNGAKKLLNKIKKHQEPVDNKQGQAQMKGAAERVWVLGASIGGPQAVEEFLMALPSNLPMAFVIAQHIGEGFVSLLAEQLDRKCKLSVNAPHSGRLLRNNQVVISPVNQRVVFDHKGHIILKPQVKKTTYNPSIDGVITEVASAYGEKAGAIIFSGMGNDGAHGVKAIKREGGEVWAQDSDSCVISAMADCARRTGCVDFSGSPTQLARRLVGFIHKIS